MVTVSVLEITSGATKEVVDGEEVWTVTGPITIDLKSGWRFMLGWYNMSGSTGVPPWFLARLMSQTMMRLALRREDHHARPLCQQLGERQVLHRHHRRVSGER